ncbi:MAG: DNA gyrase subunit A, partial [Clostridia bacterium]|nr:DNA gyrase subunit A [Clostridia bacterium]
LELLRDIDKETVDFGPNFDDTLKQPLVLPARYPNLLVNGADGIAVGMATNIPPHNLGEVIDATLAQLHDPDVPLEELMKLMPAPDFPTGGVLMGIGGAKLAYKTGRGSIIVRAKTEIEEFNDGTRSRIIVTELPYQVNKANLVKAIVAQVHEKKLEGIADVKEESDRHGMRIVIDVKKDANAQVVLNALFKQTQLQISYGIIMLALSKGEPKIMGLKEVLGNYIDHQKEVILRRTQYDLERAEERHHIVSGLVIALDNIDRVVEIIKKSKDRADAMEQLTSNFVLSERQAGAILDMRLVRLTSLEVESLHEELRRLELEIAELKSIIETPSKVVDIISNEMTEIKERFNEPRRTEVSYDYDGDIAIADLIEKEDVVISMTHFGYVKRLPVVEYKAQHRGGRGVTAHKPKEEDFVESMFVTNTHDDLLFFTSMGKVYCAKAYEIPEAQKTARGRAIVNLLQLSEGEKVTAIIPRKENSEGYLFMATKDGLVKKTSLRDFDSIRRVGKIAITLTEGDELVGVNLTTGEDEILVASSQGKCIRFAENEVRPMGREAQGVRSMNLAKDDFIVDMAVIKEGMEVITISENGYGKRSDVADYRLQARAGKGIKAGVFNAKTGKLVNLKLVNPEDDIMIISASGVVIRMATQSISKIGRDTLGVRVMKFKTAEEKVVCVANTPAEAEDIDDE